VGGLLSSSPIGCCLVQASGAALQPDLLGKHVQRSASLRALVQQLAALNVHDGEAAKQLAAAAVEVA
jgi:hypothetical protein